MSFPASCLTFLRCIYAAWKTTGLCLCSWGFGVKFRNADDTPRFLFRTFRWSTHFEDWESVFFSFFPHALFVREESPAQTRNPRAGLRLRNELFFSFLLFRFFSLEKRRHSILLWLFGFSPSFLGGRRLLLRLILVSGCRLIGADRATSLVHFVSKKKRLRTFFSLLAL